MAYELKTKKGAGSVKAYLASISDPEKRKDAAALAKLFADITGEKPVMWGDSIVGFGTYRYEGRTTAGEWLRIGFSARANSLSLYLISGFKKHGTLLRQLGPHTTGKSCLYVKRLADIDLRVLKRLAAASLAEMDKKYPRKK